VPACRECNDSYSKDDVYLRDVLVAHQEAGDCPQARDVQQAMLRSFSDPKQARYTSRFFSGVRVVNLTTPAGLLLPRQPAMVVESRRLDRVITRIIRGLFYHEFGERIPPDYEVRSFCVTDRLRQVPAEARDFIRNVFPIFNWSPIRLVGPGVFAYRVSLMPRDGYTSMWLLAFYEKVHYFACVTREDALAR
jgi:hypothetical protein